MEHGRKISSGSDTTLLGHSAEAYDSPQDYDDGDLAIRHMDASIHTPPMVMSPKTMGDRSGAYACIDTSPSTFDLEDGQSLFGDHPDHHVKRFDHNQARKTLLFEGLSKLAITIFFCAAICGALKSWEGWRRPVVLSKIDVRIFNSLTLGLSLCLGLNLLASLKHYASTLRWSFLTRRYVSLEVFDLILHISSLAKVAKLMVISSPGFRGKKWLRRFRWFKDVRDDGTKWMWLACLIWIAINIGSQVLVALLSLFWPLNNSEIPLFVRGNVTVADLRTWYTNSTTPDPEAHQLFNETQLEAAWMFGMEGMVYPEFEEGKIQKYLSGLPGTPLYRGNGSYSYRFLNRDSTRPYTNYLTSSRNISATTTCNQLEVRGQGVIMRPEEDLDADQLFATPYIEAKEPGQDWGKYAIPEQASGSITWIASTLEHCGPRCTNFTVLQYGFDHHVETTSLFLCNSTVSHISEATTKEDITTLSDVDIAAVYGNNNFSRIAAGAIGWTGISWNNWVDRQTRSYSQGSKWSPAHVVSKKEVEDMLMRFTIGAIAAFDDHGIRYNMTNQHVVPTQGQQLDVDWPYVISILGGICGIQFTALVLLVIFANRTIVRDDSFFSMAMLLHPVVARLGQRGGAMSGNEIKSHRKLRFKKIRYDYREGMDGEPNQVDIFFEGKDTREGRKSWAPGSYS